MECFSCISKNAADDVGSQRDKEISKKLKQWSKDEQRVVKILLLGTGESGKSTITKQMKIIHINGFSESERLEKVADIRRNLKDAILCIVGGMSILNIPLADSSNQESMDYIVKEVTSPKFDYPQEFYDMVIRLWDDDGIQECFRRSNEYQLIDCAKYFLNKIHVLRRDHYIPSDQDILRCRVMTNTIQRIDFAVKDGKTDVHFSVFDVGGQQGESRKWIQLFDCTTAILFILDCSSFDLVLREDQTQNRLVEAAKIFEQVWNNRFLKYVSMILFINKIDVLEDKINGGKSLNTLVDSMDEDDLYYSLFQEFKKFVKPKDGERKEFIEAFPRIDPESMFGQSNHLHLGQRKKSRSMSIRPVNDEVVRTAVFIKRMFMQIMKTPRQDEYHGGDWHDNHKCEYYYTCAVDTDNIRKVLEGCRSLLIRQHIDRYLT